jgi:uncharacterized membrane protein (DUF4010 family)
MDGALTSAFLPLGVALALGLLVGLQRERESPTVAGIRTSALTALLGASAALLMAPLGVWIVVAGFLGVLGAIVIGNVAAMREGPVDPGVTSEIALLATYIVGAMTVTGPLEVAVALGVTIAVLLQAKTALHRFASVVGEKDFRAVLQFLVVAFVVLPVLPDRAYDPFEVLNPRHIWLMVVLVVGISLGGYIAWKIVGREAGAAISGLLGGAISSTATTFSMARQAKTANDLAPAAALVILLASCVTYLRVLVEVGVVGRSFLPRVSAALLPPLAAMLLASLVVWLRARRERIETPEPKNPTQFTSALVFGALYAVVLFAVAFAKERLGQTGVYGVAVLSGLTDMDALTLSTAELVVSPRSERGEPSLDAISGSRVILVGSMANLVFKGAVVAVLGGRRLATLVGVGFGVVFVVSGATLALL